MQVAEAAGRSIIRLSYILAVLAALAIGMLAVAFERQSRAVHRQAERADALDALNLVRSNLQGVVDSNIQLLQGLVGVIEYEPTIGEDQFYRIAAQLMRSRDEVIAVSAAPGLVVSMVYPPQAGAYSVGIDLLHSPQHRQAALMARTLGTAVLAGPLATRGGRGVFIVRNPVFLESEEGGGLRFWGTVSTVIDETELYREAGLLDAQLPIDLVLVGRDGLISEGETFRGDPSVLLKDPVVGKVSLPYGAWGISAIPRGGWTPPPEMWGVRALFALAGLLVVAPILGTARLLASRQKRLQDIRVREAELSRLSWRLDFALAASNIGVWDVDLATDELIWDERTKEIFGTTGREGPFCEADWIGVVHPDDRERALAEAHATVAGSGKFASRYRVVRPDGQVRHIRDVAALFVGEDGSRRLVGLVRDETDDVLREAELDMRRQEAEAATVAKSRFLAAMSHEIRTPLSGVLGLLGLMLEEPLPPRQQERAQIALASAQSLLVILNDILDFSKLEARRIRIAPEPVEIRPLVAEVVELMAPTAARKGLELSHEIADRVPARLVADPMRLRQVLTNLLSNATKFTEEGRIVVRVDYAPGDEGEGELALEVQDTGIGIPPEQQERVFLDFVQADSSLTRRSGGTGLGLAICRQLVEMMGGAITLRSVPGMGSTFAVTIPTRPTETAAGAGGAARQETAPARPLRVLLAEDNATNRYLITAYLRAGGHAVEVVANGTEAVAATAGGRFDVVLMDVQMPEVDGLAATRAIRALPAPAGAVPIIALTANAMPEDRDACLAAGMTDYLAKPVEVAALNQALARVQPAAPPGAAAAQRLSAAG
jgi:signal transduction histidine kinase/ActR/RegA family two-component response regulator